MRKIKFYSLFIFLVASLQICAQKKYASPKPRLFLTIQDIDRAKQQGYRCFRNTQHKEIKSRFESKRSKMAERLSG